MMSTNKNKATITLVLVFIGFAVCLPFSRYFIGALLASGFAAALVGGLADWFAISALFRRPLGIPFRTEVIPRNRDRISQAIIDMVEKELLTRENIKATLDSYDVAGLILDYLENYDGKQHIKDLLAKIGGDALPKLNYRKIGQFMAGLLGAQAGKIPLASLISQVLAWSLKHGYFDKFTVFVIGELETLAREPQLRNILMNFLGQVQTVYEKNMQRRKFAGQILETFGVNALSMAAMLQQKTAGFLQKLKQDDHPLRQKLRDQAACFAESLANDEQRQSEIESWKERLVAEYPLLAEDIGAIIRDLSVQLSRESGKPLLLKWISSEVDSLVAAYAMDKFRQKRVGDLVRQGLMMLIDTHHSEIGTIVRERLNLFTTPALVDFIESRVGNDLQMIRINGSIVGGLAGMLIFLLNYWWRL